MCSTPTPKTETPTKPSFRDGKPSSTDISVTESTQSKVNKIKVNKIKEKVKERELNTLSANASVGLCVCVWRRRKASQFRNQFVLGKVGTEVLDLARKHQNGRVPKNGTIVPFDLETLPDEPANFQEFMDRYSED